MSKFKVGDRVRVLPEFEDDPDIGLGEVVELNRETDRPVCVKLENKRLVAPHVDSMTAEPVLPWAVVTYSLKDGPPPPQPSDHATRKGQPVTRGVLDYFPDAIKAVAECSRVGNSQHNAGQEMHHARSKSADHADCIVRHLMERGTVDSDGVRHSAKVAWRALALLQEELEAAGAPLARGARK